MNKMKLAIMILLIFYCFSIFYKYNEGKDINSFFNDFMSSEEYVSYYSIIHVTSSEENATYITKDKNFTHDLLNYIISLNPKKLNNTKNYKINVDNKLDISYSITILAKDENNLSNSITIDISHSNFSTFNNYNKKYNNKDYYLDDTIDNTILDILNKYDKEKYNF